jgi:hypothetical protein
MGKYDKLRTWWTAPISDESAPLAPTELRVAPSFSDDNADQLRLVAEKLISNFDNAGFVFDDEVEQLRAALDQKR